MIFQRLAHNGTQKRISELLEVSESTVSRMKEQVEPVTRLAAHLNLKVVNADWICIPPAEAAFLRRVYATVAVQAPWLLQEDQ